MFWELSVTYSFETHRQEILNYLKTHNLSASALEKKAGLKMGTLRNIIYGNSKNPTADTLVKVSNTTGLSIDQLLNGSSKSFALPDLTPTEKENLNLLFDILSFLVNHSKSTTPKKMDHILDMTKDIFKYCTTYKEKAFDSAYAQHIYEAFSKKL